MAVMFRTGPVMLSNMIQECLSDIPGFGEVLETCLRRHREGDFSEMEFPEDVETNNDAIKNGGRILNSYNTSGGKIWIITEWDRSYSTILFPEEY